MTPPVPPQPVDFPRVRREKRPRTRRIALQLGYEGSKFHGFQRQPGQRTVEGALLEALAAIGHGGGLSFASRTDTGVHATAQVVALRVDQHTAPGDFATLIAGHLPPDLRVRAVAPAPAKFHPRWSSTGKVYEYRLGTTDLEGSWNAGVLDEKRFSQALDELRRAPSLAGFTAAGAPERDAPPIRRLDERADGGRRTLVIEGPAFRRYAIRHMVGCAVAQARGELPEGSCAEIALAPPPYRRLRAPGDGLTLVEVQYPLELDPFRDAATIFYL